MKTIPAVNRDGPLLSKLFLGFMNLSDKIYETFSGLGNSLLRPICEVKLSDSSRLSVPGISDLNIYEE